MTDRRFTTTHAPSRAHRILFLTGAFFAGWVGFMALLGPAVNFHAALPVDAPPLHARTIAGFYLGGMMMMFLAARATRLSDVRIPSVIAGLFTSLLLLASLLNLDAFYFTVPAPPYASC